MSNPREGYALITSGGYDLYAKNNWPHAITVGDDYRLIAFAKTDEPNIIEMLTNLGLSVQWFNAVVTISKMELKEDGPFVVYGQDVHTVINHFNPQEEG